MYAQVVKRLSPAVGVELPQDGHQRVVRRLVSEVVEVPCRGSRARAAPSDLGDGCAQKQRVQAFHGGVALGPRGVERPEPGSRVGVQGAARLGHSAAAAAAVMPLFRSSTLRAPAISVG